MRWSRKRMLVWIAIPLLLYAVLALALWSLQDRMLFVGASWGRGVPLAPADGVAVRWLALPTGERFRVATSDARDVPGHTPHAVVVFFMGNGEDLRSGVLWAELWRGYGVEPWVVEYPGYGDSEGAPGKDTLFAAAEVACAAARERARALGVGLVGAGSSLGSFCAVHLAAAGLVDRLLLRAPPTSIRAAARDRFPWLPVGWLLRHEFDSLALAGSVRCPLLVVHGERDTIVPATMGRELVAACGGPAEFVPGDGFGHNDLPFDRGGPFGERIDAFLRAR